MGTFYLLFFYGSFIVLFLKNLIQIPRLGQLIQYFHIFVDSVLLLLLALGLRKWLRRVVRKWDRWLVMGLLALLWLVPVFWTPGAVYRASLPEKPLLVAHRGASMLAPENTLASMQSAAGLGVFALETDVTISRDGTFFLMHDSTLARTTNVAQVYPDRARDLADSFTWDELQQLNAGQWFVEQDPFGTIASGLVPPEQANAYRSEQIPAFSEMLAVVRDNHLHFIYDLRIPASDHPYADQTLNLCLAEIEAAGVASQAWVLASLEEIPAMRAALAEATLAAGIDYKNAPSPEEVVAEGYQLVNSEYGLSNRMIHAYRKAGLWVNL